MTVAAISLSPLPGNGNRCRIPMFVVPVDHCAERQRPPGRTFETGQPNSVCIQIYSERRDLLTRHIKMQKQSHLRHPVLPRPKYVCYLGATHPRLDADGRVQVEMDSRVNKEPVSATARDVTLGTALRIVLKESKARFVVKDGTLHILPQ